MFGVHANLFCECFVSFPTVDLVGHYLIAGENYYCVYFKYMFYLYFKYIFLK